MTSLVWDELKHKLWGVADGDRVGAINFEILEGMAVQEQKSKRAAVRPSFIVWQY